MSDEPALNPADNDIPSAWSSLFELLKTVALFAIVAIVIRTFLIQPFIVDGSSMEPTFHNQEYILVDKLSYHFHNPKRGDVIVFHPPFREDNFIKRIIGLPGDTVEVRGEVVRVNGTVVTEPYVNPTANQMAATDGEVATTKVTLADDQYFVMGDNRDHSKDSRELGPIPRTRFIGHAWLVLFPFDKLSLVPQPTYAFDQKLSSSLTPSIVSPSSSPTAHTNSM